jgi:MFS family permease
MLRGLTRYQWLVIAAAWLGWGFDVFDALLFNFVAGNAVTTLLGLEPGSAAARQQTVYWTGVLSSLLLVGWAVGGVLFGWLADRYGRKRALMLTVLVYGLGTALCAFATSLPQLIVFRALTSLGIGGEWAVGAALVAETVPEQHRVAAGTLLQTASPLGIFLASVVNYQIAGVWFVGETSESWRYVFLCGLAPVFLALLVRFFIHESDRWQQQSSAAPRAALIELVSPENVAATRAAVLVSVAGLLTWWAVNAFIPALGGMLAAEQLRAVGQDPANHAALVEAWKARASNAFNLGGLLGCLAAIPLASRFGRRPMFVSYFLASAASIALVFGLPLSPSQRIAGLFLVGLPVYGVFSCYVFYLPELFPTRLRALGAGFSFNIGRVLAAVGPFIVGSVAARAGGASQVVVDTLLWVALVPLLAALLSWRWVIETRDRRLPT